MKELNLYKIRDLALASKRAVYTVQQLSHLTGKPKDIVKVYASRLVSKGLATRLMRGRISFVDDLHVIASQLVEPTYISIHSALAFHDLFMQIPKYIECVTTKNSRRYENLGIAYHRIPSKLFYGYEKHSKSGSYIFVANPEKGLIDVVYLNKMTRNQVIKLKTKLDKKKLKEYVERFEGRGKGKLVRWLI